MTNLLGIFKMIKNEFQKIPMRDQKQRQVSRQAYAGLLWSKQFYYYVIEEWLKGDSNQPKPPASRLKGRNYEWLHLFNMDIISMPDKWEYPWVIILNLKLWHTFIYVILENGNLEKKYSWILNAFLWNALALSSFQFVRRNICCLDIYILWYFPFRIYILCQLSDL